MTPKQKQILSTYFPDISGGFQDTTNDELLRKLLDPLVLKMKIMKGDKGDSPVKGKDYWTEDEINKVIKYILKNATPIKGRDYVDGEKGDSYILTYNDKKEIAESINVPVVEKIIEKTEIIKEVLPKEIDVSRIKDAVSKNDLEINDRRVLDGMARIDGRIKLIDQRWGAHGGGLKFVSHDDTLSGEGTLSSPLSVIGGGSGGFSVLTAAETVDGSITVFTFLSATSQPTFIVSDGASMRATASDGTVNWTWDNILKQATMTIPPQDDIVAIVSSSGSSGSVTYYDNEVVAGSGTSFTLANTPSAGSVHVYALGQRLVPITDYSISGSVITTVFPWSIGDIVADYRSGSTSGFVDSEIASGSGNTFTLSQPPLSGSVQVYGLGQRLTLTTDYSILGTTITTVSTWSSGEILVDYRV